MIGTSLGHYEIIEPLGAGGMGEVCPHMDTHQACRRMISEVNAEFSVNLEQLGS